MKIQKVILPKYSILFNRKFDYSDSYKSVLDDAQNNINSIDVGKAFFSSTPKWIGSLFKFRNLLASLFKLKTGEKVENQKEVIQYFKGKVGERIGLFQVFERSASELILGEDDRHLNFRVSLLLGQEHNGLRDLTISTTVSFNNWFGKVYFVPVKPFHKLIVPSMLKGTLKELESGLSPL